MKKQWDRELQTEISFWEAIIAGTHSQTDWVKDFHTRLAEKQFPDYLARFITKSDLSKVKIIDIGAGPHTDLGLLLNGVRLNITAIDPLADSYDRLFEKYGKTPLIKTVKGDGETLCNMFDDNEFDIIYSRNALDHSYNPLRVIQNMVQICMPGGVIFFQCAINEGVNEGYSGLHQWNFLPVDNDVVIWNRENEAALLSKIAPETTLDVQPNPVKDGFTCSMIKTVKKD